MTRLAWLSPNGTDICRVEGPPTKILVSTMSGVAELVRDDPAVNDWRLFRSSLKGHHVSAIAVDPFTGTAFAATHGTGLYRSRNGGRTWEPAMNGLASMHIFSLGLDAREGTSTVYAGTEPAMLFRSSDFGDHWQELPALREVPEVDKWTFPAPPHVAHTKHVVADPRDPATLFVCIEQGAVMKSTDGGASFKLLRFMDQKCRLNNDTHRIVFNPADPDDLLLTGGDGIFRSRDAGESWQRIAYTDIQVAYPDQIYFDPEDGETLFAVGAGSPPYVWRETGDATPAIVRTRDGGKNWERLDHGMPHGLTGNFEAASILSWPGGYGFLLGTSDGEVLASFNKGESWELVASDLHPVSKCIHFKNIAAGRALMAAAQVPSE